MDHSIVFKNVSHVYNPGTPFEHRALRDVNLEIPRGQVTSIIGHTGSGKSTLIQHLNVLKRPSHGSVNIEGTQVTKDSDHDNLKQLRKRVGVVFQFPEAQLFEETVLKDVMFGPLNFGVSEEEARQIARKQLGLVGLPEFLYDRSPFDLSGGQMRRVAIAGVLALEPEILVLDEPTAGLDPKGHHEIMEMFMALKEDKNLTLIMVSHQMDDVARYSDFIAVMEAGTVIRTGSPEEIFSNQAWLLNKQLNLPGPSQFLADIEARLPDHLVRRQVPLTVESLADVILDYHQQLKEEKGAR